MLRVGDSSKLRIIAPASWELALEIASAWPGGSSDGARSAAAAASVAAGAATTAAAGAREEAQI